MIGVGDRPQSVEKARQSNAVHSGDRARAALGATALP